MLPQVINYHCIFNFPCHTKDFHLFCNNDHKGSSFLFNELRSTRVVCCQEQIDFFGWLKNDPENSSVLAKGKSDRRVSLHRLGIWHATNIGQMRKRERVWERERVCEKERGGLLFHRKCWKPQPASLTLYHSTLAAPLSIIRIFEVTKIIISLPPLSLSLSLSHTHTPSFPPSLYHAHSLSLALFLSHFFLSFKDTHWHVRAGVDHFKPVASIILSL